MKTLTGRMGGRIDLSAVPCGGRIDLDAVHRVRQEIGGVVAQLPVRWHESAEGAVLLRTYTLLCAVEAYLTAEETKLGFKSEPAEANIDKFLGEVCPEEVLKQSAAEARTVYAGLRDGAFSPACAVGAAYKPLYDEGYVYIGMNADVLSAMKGHYETISSAVEPLQNVGDGSMRFSKGENATDLLSAVEGLFRLYVGATAVQIVPGQDVKASKYRIFTLADHGGKALGDMLLSPLLALYRGKEV